MQPSHAFALTLRGDPQVNLGGVLRWLDRVDAEQQLRWRVDFLETTGPDDDALGASLTDTRSLARLTEHQVIELSITGQREKLAICCIILRDGASLDLLGRGELPTPFELGCRYDAFDPKAFGWE